MPRRPGNQSWTIDAKRIAKFTFGLVTLLVGGTMLAGYAYFFVARADGLTTRIGALVGLPMPFLFIWFCWEWMRREPSRKTSRYGSELILTLKLLDDHFGTPSER